MPYPHVERHTAKWSTPMSAAQAYHNLVAYQLWQEAGEPEDMAIHFWLEAERQIREETRRRLETECSLG